MRKAWVFILLVLMAGSCGLDQDLLDALAGDAAVELLFPENVSECTEGTILSETQSEVVFRWSDTVENATYQVNLTNLISNTTEILDSESTELPVTLQRGIPYSWFIVDLISGEVRSDTWTFYNAGPGVESFIPFPAAAITPILGAVLQTTSSIDLIWNSSDLDDDIVEYDLYFGLEANPPLLEEQITDSFFNDITVVSGETYYWKIVTRDFVGNESNSEIFNFQVE